MANEKRMMYADDFLDLFYVASAGQDKAFIKAVEMVVEDTPTVDAVEVVHGRWVTDEKGISYCDRCRVIDDYASVHNYCPICGAKMDGGNEDV